MVTCDRYEHLKNEIIPALKNGQIVILDRYILSSLILQRMDGVDADYIMRLNENIIKPDLQIAVYADGETLQKRLEDRQILTRFEKGFSSEKELYFMKLGIEILLKEGIEITEIWNNKDFERNVELVTHCIIQRVGKQ